MSIPLVRLNQLDLLRGFVAVGRRMSITRAADDLCLTQSAVSKQVRALEDALGVPLLRRGHRAISFTPEGERLFRSADAALQQLQDAMGAAAGGQQRAVTVTASIGVTGLWLLPRLNQFQRLHEDIDVRVAAHNAVLDLRAEGIDLAIRYCTAEAAPRGAERLFSETVAPVASPKLKLKRLTRMDALASHHLLEYDDGHRPWLQWQGWLAARGWENATTKGVLRFNQYDQVIQAAIAGHGIALGRLELLTPLLSEGKLVDLRAAHQGPGSDRAYWLIHGDAQPRAAVACVADWIRSEAKVPAPPSSPQTQTPPARAPGRR